MKIKLRIPLFLFVVALVSSFIQLIDISNPSTILFYTTIGLIFSLLEKTGINDKKVHILFGLLIIIIGIVADYISM